MIKVIAFDMVGVLVREKDIDLTEEESKIERMFGKNISDSEFLSIARKVIPNDSLLIKTTESLIEKIYEVREPELFKKLKNKYPNIKIVIATNHVSYIRNFIGEAIGVDFLDDIYISAEIHKIKPESNFYEHILDRQNIKSDELLFLDDSQENIEGAIKLGINTIKINKDTKIFEGICNWFENNY